MKPETGTGLPRWFDTVAAAAGLVVLAPLLLLIAALVAATSRGPVLYRQKRVGKGGRQFQMLKFRTMVAGRHGPGVTKDGDPRITRAGTMLRKTKLDELPELWNVVRGDMSLVGPRPELAQYVDLSNPLWREVLHARPGITDPVTLRLRNEEQLLAAAGAGYEGFYRRLLLPYKLRGYREYLAARTWKRDVAVLFSTILSVIMPGRAPVPSPGEISRPMESM